jgi:hypothetical protein
MFDVKVEKELRGKAGIASPSRFRELLREMIVRLDLDLPGLIVLTGAASGNYVCTPLIAARETSLPEGLER